METPKFAPKPDLRYLFKSYYVVWKQTNAEQEKVTKKSLNRTMQYGNTKSRAHQDVSLWV